LPECNVLTNNKENHRIGWIKGKAEVNFPIADQPSADIAENDRDDAY
jgi:hypothetical protein